MLKKITLKQYIFIKDLRAKLSYSKDIEKDSELTIIQASHLIKKLVKMLNKKVVIENEKRIVC